MYTGMLHTHKLLVTLFVLIYLIKTVLLFLNKKEALDNFSKKVKVPEMIISVLFLATGIYLLTQTATIETYMIVKIVGVLVAIPLAVIGVKKHNKLTMILSFLVLIYIYGIAETKSPTFVKKVKEENLVTDPSSPDYDITAHGKVVYKTYCVRCHGEDGDLQLQGSPKLSQSQLSAEQRKMIINNGGSLMPSFEKQLSGQEVEAVATYLNELQK